MQFFFISRCQQADETLRKLLAQKKLQHKLEPSGDPSLFVVNSEDTNHYINQNITLKYNANRIKLFGCKYCNFSTVLKSEYVQHRQTVHNTIRKQKKIKSNDAFLIQKADILTNKGSDLTENGFKCNFCDYVASTKLMILTHRKVHKVLKTLHCEHCKFQTNLRASLQAHIRIHTGDKPYLCDQCHLKFTQLAHLKQHQFTLDRKAICM